MVRELKEVLRLEFYYDDVSPPTDKLPHDAKAMWREICFIIRGIR